LKPQKTQQHQQQIKQQQPKNNNNKNKTNSQVEREVNYYDMSNIDYVSRYMMEGRLLVHF